MERLLTFASFILLILLPISWAESEAGGAKVSVAESEADVVKDGEVFVLTDKSFKKFIDAHEYTLVEFYAPWCGHCKALAPQYLSAAEKLKKMGSKAVLAKVDCTEEKETAQAHDVSAYPTLKLFRNGKPQDFTGGRTDTGIVDWLEKMTGPASVAMKADEDPLKGGATIAFVCYVKSVDSELYKIYISAGDSLRNLPVKFFHVERDGEEELTVSRADEGITKYEGEKDATSVKAWLSRESFPLFGPISGENYRDYIDHKLDLVWFASDEDAYKEHRATLSKAAKVYRKEYSFVWLDTKKFGEHAKSALAVDEKAGPALVYQSPNGRFIFPGGKEALSDSDKIVKFFADVKDGKIQRSLKSEDIPTKNDEPVKIVVGKNFEEMVFRKDKDVFLEVYAPWCGHCKQIEPDYKLFASIMAKRAPHMVVAKLDGSANESPVKSFSWSGFPTLAYIPAGSDTPKMLEGERSVKAFIAFAKTHTTKPFEVEDSDLEKAEDAQDEADAKKDEL